jgi:hypothetical protein
LNVLVLVNRTYLSSGGMRPNQSLQLTAVK